MLKTRFQTGPLSEPSYWADQRMLAEAGIIKHRWEMPDPASPGRNNSEPISPPPPNLSGSLLLPECRPDLLISHPRRSTIGPHLPPPSSSLHTASCLALCLCPLCLLSPQGRFYSFSLALLKFCLLYKVLTDTSLGDSSSPLFS